MVGEGWPAAAARPLSPTRHLQDPCAAPDQVTGAFSHYLPFPYPARPSPSRLLLLFVLGGGWEETWGERQPLVCRYGIWFQTTVKGRESVPQSHPQDPQLCFCRALFVARAWSKLIRSSPQGSGEGSVKHSHRGAQWCLAVVSMGFLCQWCISSHPYCCFHPASARGMQVAAENLQVAEDRESACALPGSSIFSHFALG